MRKKLFKKLSATIVALLATAALAGCGADAASGAEASPAKTN